MDLTGRFPYKSSWGNKYILIAYHVDSNTILGTPVRNKQAKTIKQAWLHLHNKLSFSSNKPNTYILDNETSGETKSTISTSTTT